MSELVLLGDEALAVAAVDAGLSAAYGYPGTPSTEIIEYLEKFTNKSITLEGRQPGELVTSWCVNEKTAYEAALGTSFAGRRALVTMKHVGLNVAADPFMNSALLQIGGGLVLAVADDPGMHSSQDEQDSRYYADFAKIICLEPRNQQETYDMTRLAFDLSEQFHIPVMIRLVTRLAHSRAPVKPAAPRQPNPVKKAEDPRKWMLLPALARANFSSLLDRQKEFFAFTEEYSGNSLELSYQKKDIGVITTGLGRNYYEENVGELPEKPSHLHISAYPIPVEKVRKLCRQVSKVVVLEEGEPFVEKYLRGLVPPQVHITGKLDGKVPPMGELNPDNIRPALGLPVRKSPEVPPDLPGRPPQLCKGCPHGDTYDVLNEAKKAYDQSIVTADIGCYALGAGAPYNAIETIVCMGASVGMARGASDAGFRPVVAVIGDSTFLHSGITALMDAAVHDTDMTLIILDNSTVAMTGGQATILPSEKLERLILGIGVDPKHLRKIVPLKKNFEENVKVLRKEMDHKGLSVILSVRECIVAAKKSKKKG